MQSDLKIVLENSGNSCIKYKLITKESDANKILSTILKDKGCVLGIDIEAAVEMSRFGILCLLQVY
jgi:hypothetical protein